MINYTNYDFYINEYMGDMSETDFEKLALRASAEVRKNIFNRNIEKYKNEVQMATCSVADILSRIEQLKSRKDKLVSSEAVDKVVSSESVGDLSRTFANTSNLNELDKEISNQKAKIKEEITLYLLHTGLLYRGV